MGYWCGVTAIPLGYKTSEFTGFFVWIFLEKIKPVLTCNSDPLVANLLIH